MPFSSLCRRVLVATRPGLLMCAAVCAFFVLVAAIVPAEAADPGPASTAGLQPMPGE